MTARQTSIIDTTNPQTFTKIFFMTIDKDIPERIDTFIRRLIWTLIVLNILIGVPTIYDMYLHDHTPKVYRDISTIPTSEI